MQSSDQIMNKTFHPQRTIAAIKSVDAFDIVWEAVAYFLAVIANTSLLILELKIWRSRKRITQPKLLVVFLALTDLVMMVFGVTPRFFLIPKDPCDISAYKGAYLFAEFSLWTFYNLSKFTVIVMGIERFLAIQKPFVYVRHCTVKLFCWMEVVVVVYSLLYGVFALFAGLEVFRNLSDRYFSSIDCRTLILTIEYVIAFNSHKMAKKFSVLNAFNTLTLVQDVILITVLVVCNVYVMYALKDMKDRLLTACPPSKEEFDRQVDIIYGTGKEFSRLMIAIILASIVMTIPLVIRIICGQVGVLRSVIADFICRRLAISIGVVNPFLYGLLRKKLRSRIINVLCSGCQLCVSNIVYPMDTVNNESENSPVEILQRPGSTGLEAQESEEKHQDL